MYGGFEVYKEYLAVKNHFTSKSYDYAKYDGKVNVKLESFTKRNDRHFFHKLSKRFAEREITDYFVCNFLVSNKWVGDLLKHDGSEEYTKWKKYQDSYRYFFRNDMVLVSDDFVSNSISFDDGLSVANGQHPRLLRLYLRQKIHFQSLYIIDRIVSFSRKWDKEIDEKVVWPEISKKLKKVKPFVAYNLVEMKNIMKEVFNAK